MLKTLALSIISLFFISNSRLCAQAPPLLPLVDNQAQLIEKIASDNAVNAQAAYQLLASWNHYPELKDVGHDYTWYYTDSVFGKMPVRVYIPSTYNNNHPSPCIFMLHGAAGGSRFKDIDSVDKSDDLSIFEGLKSAGYIIIRPVAGPDKKFSWVVNEYGQQINPAYQVLNSMLIALKHVLNIDDNRVFAFGHSDGSDGSVGLGVYTPDALAGIVAYNSMLANIFAGDFYIRNIANRPLYLVHSDKDDLRPIQQTREILTDLKLVDDTIHYREYTGYVHFDKHLQMDLPLAIKFMKATMRYTFRNRIYWETNNTSYSTCDWLHITSLNKSQTAQWYQPLAVKGYDKTKGIFPEDRPYYYGLATPSAVEATYSNNTFYLNTSGIGQLELKISPQMVDTSKPVIVYINGKKSYEEKVTWDKKYLLNNFNTNSDRSTLWIDKIILNVD